MKKKVFITFFLCFLVFNLLACSNGADSSKLAPEKTIEKNKTAIDLEGFNLYDSYDLEQLDNSLKSIEMYVAAEKDEFGDFMWDDGQEWLLLVKDTDGEYILFKDYVQLAELNYFVYTEGDDFHIASLRPGSASLILTDYLFDEAEGKFTAREVFNPENVNMYHYK